MKLHLKSSAALLCLIQLAARTLPAQTDTLYGLQPLPIQVGAESTVSLSFPCAVKTLDRGSAALLAQKAKGADNVVLLKAASKDIKPTSLIVITQDGKLHAFQATYQEPPSRMDLRLLEKPHSGADADPQAAIGKDQIQRQMQLAAEKAPNIHIKGKAGGLHARMDGFYVAGPLMLVRLSLQNRSVIGYDGYPVRVLTEDKKRLKRAASQKDPIPLLHNADKAANLKASEKQTIVLVFAKLTIAATKRISVLITERGGARSLTLHLSPKHFKRIKSL